ncbi:autophagy-related protein 5 [Fistulifera solaris]|uniref:Autophagy protein 5 n=1 Tax=Fistulifera solaris TaxID=1519565 RepID=A0A1Z5JDD3_FISSO|nr:autophagy-related protein 5 [Fistulifera solaris]|eukprot:GAX12007.1 autophagy-related protein 5 [Fistulifera solaris]
MNPSQESPHLFDSETVKRINNDGRIPVVVTLAPTSLSAPTGPPPLHFLVSRQTYLHLGLSTAIRRLHPFAPIAFQGLKWQEPDPGELKEEETDTKEPIQPTDNSKSDLPDCWWEDEATQAPLRWQLFTGVLYDMHANHTLPWRLRLHFNNFPSQLLPFSIQALRSHFQNSIKQAIALRAGSGRAALQWMTKEAHDELWNNLQEAKCGSRHEWRSRITEDVTNQRIPVRVLLSSNSLPCLQKSCLVDRQLRLGGLLRDWLPDLGFDRTMDTDQDSLADFSSAGWKIQGINPSLDLSVLDLWECLCHPDSYLYIVVSMT